MPMAKGKGRKEKQRSTNIMQKTKERATRTPVRTVDNSGAPEG